MTSSAKRAELDALVDRFQKQFPDVPSVSPEQLEARLAADDKVVLVDVRTRAEQWVSMLPGNAITAGEFEKHRERYSAYNVVCYCTVGSRSARYAQSLRQQQVDASYLRGGILGWTQSALPLVDAIGSSPAVFTEKVHIYLPTLALQGDGYTPVLDGTPTL